MANSKPANPHADPTPPPFHLPRPPSLTQVLSKADQFAKKGLSTKGMASMASFFKPKPK